MSCRIVLDNPGSYHPGDTVYGRVVVNFSSRENFRAIRCRFRGKEHTAWTERESYYDSSSKSTKYRTVHYSGDHTFIYVNLDLVGEGSLQAGRYEYPFSFTFPSSNLPNPYHGNYGYIRYYIKANVDKSFAFDYEDEITLSLLSPINFNDFRNELQLTPVGYKDEKILCCMCCASEPITMDLILEKEAFVLGEVAKIKVDISNMSNETITELNLKLKMTIESKTTSPRTHHKYDTELVAFLSDTGVGAHGQRVYNLDFVIPAGTVLPNFRGSTLFKQWCVLKAEAVIPGCHTNLEIETGVRLGHIPILSRSIEGPRYIPASQCPGGPFPAAPMNFNPPPYPQEEKAPPYPSGDKAPPYPVGPPSFPLPNGNDMGFVDGAKVPLLPGTGMPMPSPGLGGPSSSAASAPREEGAPTAPSKAKMAEEEGFEILDDEGKDEPPPPSYQDFVKGTGSNPTAPSAPPK